MDFPEDQITELKNLGEVLSAQEGGVPYFIIRALKLPDGCTPNQCDALLCPVPANGYNSRLYFSQKVQPAKAVTLNWNANDVRILEQNWHAFSWKLTHTNLRLIELVALHLKILQ